ncbi:MAG: dihydroorotase [Flavobacteriales bacterium]
MNILIKKAKIFQRGNTHHLKTRDIHIKNGKIKKIASSITDKSAKEIKAKGLCVSPGWLDLRVNFKEPGEEYKEGLENGLKTSAKGGFTGVVTMPTTYPAVDNNTAVQFLKTNSSASATEIFPAGSISKGLKGAQLSEFYDMHKSGAVAFTEDTVLASNTNLMSKALEYSKSTESLIYSFPYDPQLVSDGQMNEGKTSTLLGMRGIPNVSEELQLSRDIQLLKHFGGRLHVVAISTAGSVEMIKAAKKEGANITCSIHAHQLSFTEEAVSGFDSRFKVLPPFRSKNDRKALIKGLKQGTIDAICSGHEPEDIEEKKREFTEAAFGISSLETAFSAACTELSDSLELEEIVSKFSEAPREILNLPKVEITEGAEANLTLFNPTEQWTFHREEMLSKSKNSPYNGMTFTGKVLGVVNRGKSLFD